MNFLAEKVVVLCRYDSIFFINQVCFNESKDYIYDAPCVGRRTECCG